MLRFNIFVSMRLAVIWTILMFCNLYSFGQGTADSLLADGSIAKVAAAPWLNGQGLDSTFKATAEMKGALQGHPFYAFTAQPLQRPIWEATFRSDDQLFYFFVAILFFYAMLRIVYSKYLEDLFTLFFRATLKQQQLREQMSQVPLASLLFNGLFVVSASIYFFYVSRYFQSGNSIRFSTWVLYAMAAITAIYTVKFLVLKVMGWLIGLKKTFDAYIFIVFMLNKVLGILLLPVLLLLSFPYLEHLNILLPASLVLLVFFGVYRYLIAFRQIRNEINISPLHFFIYLCGLEIAPLLVIGKVLFQLVKRV